MVHQLDQVNLFSGSVDHTLARLLLWSQRPTRGLARVEFYSEFSRQKVTTNLSQTLQKEGITFTEIRLPLWAKPAYVLNFLVEKLKAIESGVVSISGFETAFDQEYDLLDALRILNFNRERLADFNCRQIWWMSDKFQDRAIYFMPDLNSWFSLRLSLKEDNEKPTINQLGIINSVFSDNTNIDIKINQFVNPIFHNLPNSGVAKFVGRDEILVKINQILETDSRLVLQGMGGCGKTELALQYAWQQWNQENYSGGVCWLNALNSDIGLQILSFASSRLGLELPETGILAERVAFCWQHWPQGKVLIIIDDLRDYGLIEPYLQSLNDNRFKVIITTRFRYLRHTIPTINLDSLIPENAITLLRSYVTDHRIDDQLEQAKLLCQDLDYLPLALDLVARLLRKQEHWTVQQLREKLLGQDLTDQNFVKKPKFNSEPTTEREVKAVFDLSWQGLESNAQKLALYLSLFALAPFSKTLIDSLFPEEDSEDLQVCLDDLVSLHFVNDLGDDFYNLHTLIRHYLRDKLEESQFKNEAKRAYCKEMVDIAQKIPETPVLDDIATFEPFIDHLKIATEELNQWLEDDDLDWPFVGLGRFYQGQGLYSEAVPYREQCLKLSERRLGKEHPTVATSLNNLATLYVYQGKYEEAEPLFLRSLAIDKKNHGENYPYFATSLNNLASLYESQGKYAEAEPLYLRSLAIREKQLGENHPDFAQSLNNLALLYKSQGKYEEAEPLYLRSLAIREKQLGENHPNVATSLNNLAALYDSKGKYEEAEPLYLRSLAIREKQLGENHPDVATSLNNLALLYKSQGKYEEAEPLYQRALQIFKKTLGVSHPHTITVRENYALCLKEWESSKQTKML